MLLDFHISREAREKLLGQIVLRAQSQFYRVLHSVYVTVELSTLLTASFTLLIRFAGRNFQQSIQR